MQFDEAIEQLLDNRKEIRFDTFIIEKMGFSIEEGDKESKEKIRHDAFHEFRRRTGRKDMATMPTMRRWFGIGGFHEPSREEVFEMCFAMQLDREETRQYLTVGIAGTSYQINDYHETIYLYGLEHSMSFEECISICKIFEQSLDHECEFSKTKSTKELRRQFEDNKALSRDEFILWLIDRRNWFKGYSQTSMSYLAHLRQSILTEIQEDAKSVLEPMLGEIGYYAWNKKKKRKNNHEYALIKEYMDQYSNKEDYAVIMELAEFAYKNVNSSKRMLDTLYEWEGKTVSERRAGVPHGLSVMTEKHLSDLLNIPQRREMVYRINHCLMDLDTFQKNEPCPEWAQEICRDYGREEPCITVKDAYMYLNEIEPEYRRRCLALQRSDILPLIHYTAQSRYLEKNGSDYEQKQAVREFKDYANAILNACNMPEIDEAYCLDALLLSCFQENDMYSYGELLDVLNERK